MSDTVYVNHSFETYRTFAIFYLQKFLHFYVIETLLREEHIQHRTITPLLILSVILEVYFSNKQVIFWIPKIYETLSSLIYNYAGYG